MSILNIHGISLNYFHNLKRVICLAIQISATSTPWYQGKQQSICNIRNYLLTVKLNLSNIGDSSHPSTVNKIYKPFINKTNRAWLDTLQLMLHCNLIGLPFLRQNNFPFWHFIKTLSTCCRQLFKSIKPENVIIDKRHDIACNRMSIF